MGFCGRQDLLLSSATRSQESALSESETIHLAADISFLHTDYLWRLPGSWIGYPY